jgi:transcriptional regulator with GAF, ATPase, and Fis domain
MTSFSQLLLDIWREACQHIQLTRSLQRITPMLGSHLPVGRVLIRAVELPLGRIVTLATGQADQSLSGHLPAASNCPSDVLRRISTWCLTRTVLRHDAMVIHNRYPGLLPERCTGSVLIYPLQTSSDRQGVLIFQSQIDTGFTAEHEEMIQWLAEPFAAAMENDHHLRELERLQDRLEADNRSLLTRLGRKGIIDTIVGAESGLRQVMERARLVAATDSSVLILGQTGSGKEVVARAIHQYSTRDQGPFCRVNCGAIPPDLVDSELFGHERGSFTGAVQERRGWFERADGGTLFLDEVGELPSAAQVRLLRVLQDGTFERVGGQTTLHVDVRVVAATHRDLKAMVNQGLFREDLWYRMAVFPILIPPLCDRPEDIPAMASHFAQRAASRFGLPVVLPSTEDINILINYAWPGNVRELQAVIDRAAILGNGKTLDITGALGIHSSPTKKAESHVVLGGATQHIEPLDDVIRQAIVQALRHCHGRIHGPHGAARLLQINANTLRSRMRKLGIPNQAFKSDL